MSSLPASTEAEQVILGCILLEAELYYEAAELLYPDDFSLDSHRRIWAAMRDLDAETKEINLITLRERLIARNELDAVGGSSYLMSLTEGLPQRSNIRQHVAIISEKSILRQLYQNCRATADRVIAPEATSKQCLGELEDALLKIQAEGSSSSVVQLCEFSEQWYASVKDSATRKAELLGLSFGIDAIDELTTGIRKKQLVLVGGRTGEGKSVIATQTICTNCSNGIPVLLITPEMSRDQVLERICIQTAGVPAWKFHKKIHLTQADLENIRAAKERAQKWPLFIDDSGSITAQQIAARARIAKKQHGIQLVIVDYVQIIEGCGRDERERVTGISRHLRMLAKECVPVMALSQMPRPRTDDLNKWPTKYDLKESGSLENDASTILLIFRTTDPSTHLPTGEDYIIVPKQRHGPVGHAAVVLHEDRLRFEPRSVR